MPENRHGKYHLSAPLKHLRDVGWVIDQEGMFEGKGKLLSFAFIEHLSLRIILNSLKRGILRHAWVPGPEGEDASPE